MKTAYEILQIALAVSDMSERVMAIEGAIETAAYSGLFQLDFQRAEFPPLDFVGFEDAGFVVKLSPSQVHVSWDTAKP